jgi:hypothetical protein
MRNHLRRRQTTWRVALTSLLLLAAAGRDTATSSPAWVRGGHKVTKLADGTVLFTGGHDSEAYLTSAENDPATGTWHIARNGHTAKP